MGHGSKKNPPLDTTASEGSLCNEHKQKAAIELRGKDEVFSACCQVSLALPYVKHTTRKHKEGQRPKTKLFRLHG